MGVDDGIVQRTRHSNCVVLVPEPLIDETGDVSGIHVGDLRGDLCAADYSVEISCLPGVIPSHKSRVGVTQQFVPVLVASTEDLMCVNLRLTFSCT